MALCENTGKHYIATRMMQGPRSDYSPPPSYMATLEGPVGIVQGVEDSNRRIQNPQHEQYPALSDRYHVQSLCPQYQNWDSSAVYNSPEYGIQNNISQMRLGFPNNSSCLLYTQPALHQPSQGPKPCVIPQVTKVFGGAHLSPFVRARAPELEQYGLSSIELLMFIDELNESFLANPALRLIGAAGSLVSFVPLASTQIAGGAISLTAGLSATGVSFIRTKIFMKKANETIFKPKGLHAQICKTGKMLNDIGMANNGAVFARQQSRAVLESTEIDGRDNPISRRMEVLGDSVMRLSFDNVNAPIKSDNWVKKVGAYPAQQAASKQLEKLNKKQHKSERKSVKHQRKVSKTERKREKANEKADEKANVIMEDMEGLRAQMEKLDSNSRHFKRAHKELRKQRKKLEKDLREVEKDRCERVDKSHKAERDVQKQQHDPGKKTNKILWVVIMPDSEYASGGDDDWDSDSRAGGN